MPIRRKTRRGRVRAVKKYLDGYRLQHGYVLVPRKRKKR